MKWHGLFNPLTYDDRAHVDRVIARWNSYIATRLKKRLEGWQLQPSDLKDIEHCRECIRNLETMRDQHFPE